MTRPPATRTPGTSSRLRRVVPGWAVAAALAGGGALAVAPGPDAFAQYGPAAQCSLSVNPTAVFAGQSFTVTATVGPGELASPTTALVLISGSAVPLGTLAVPVSGTTSATFTAPASAGPGLHTITVDACSATLATSVTIQPSTSPGTSGSSASVPQAGAAVPAESSSSSLAFTGADLAATVAASALAIGGGGALILLSRRRRSGA